MTKIILLGVLLFIGTIVSGQSKIFGDKDKGSNYKLYAGIRANKAIFSNDTRYKGFDIGLKVKCKVKFGYSYSQLKGTFQSDLYPADAALFPAVGPKTKTDAKFHAFVFEPVIIKDKKINVSIPIRAGIAIISSDYRVSRLNYNQYYKDNSPYTEIGANVDYRILGIIKIGVSLSYRYVKTDLSVATVAFNTPLLGLSIKIGRMCK